MTPLTRMRTEAHARLARAAAEGERDVRERMAAALRRLAEDIQTMPVPRVRLIAAMLRQLRDQEAR